MIYSVNDLILKMQKREKMPTLTNFTTVMVIAFGVLSWLLQNLWLNLPGLLILILFFLKSPILQTLNRLWFQFGVILAWLISPVMLTVLYFFIITPFALITRPFRTQKKSWIEHSEAVNMRTPF